MWPDGEVISNPEAPWLSTKVWRGQPEELIYGRELSVSIADECVSSCVEGVGVAGLAIRVENLGPQAARLADLAIYGVTGDGGQALLWSYQVTETLEPGVASGTIPIEVDVAQAQRGLWLIAGDPGDGSIPRDDCDPDNNALFWRLEACDL